MTRIDAKFAELKAAGKKAFVTYVMAGDPDYSTSLEVVKGLPAAGVDIIELGLPFTDPMADGPTIQLAGQRALDGGMTLERTLEIARRFHTVFLSHVPPLGGKQVERIKARGTEDGAVGSQSTGERRVMIGQSDDPARRFIALVDELYDRHVNLYLSADCNLQTLYQGDLLTFEFERTRSRLTEMASVEYQSTQHLP